jgi:hypothetical protein
MHKRIALAMVMILLLSLSLFADWTYRGLSISIPAADDFLWNTGAFGVVAGATDGFDEGVDVSHPPCPPSGPCVYFPSTDALVTMLEEDYRGTVGEGESAVWSIYISGSMVAADANWDISALPAGGEFLALAHYPPYPPAEGSWATAVNMREVSTLALMPAQMLSVKWSNSSSPVDVTAPYVTNMIPANGATGVDASTSLSLDIIDDGTGVNSSSVHIRYGFLDLVSFATVTPITGGFRYSYSPPTDLPAGEFTAIIEACDNADPANCLTGFVYSFTVSESETTYYIISGNVTLEGTTDYSGVSVSDPAFPGVSATTSATGDYVITAPDAGTYNLVASKAGYTTSDPVAVVLTESMPIVTGINFHLTASAPEMVSLYGRVSLTGTPVPTDLSGSTVTAGTFGSSTTNVDGDYMIRTLIPTGERFHITVTHDGYDTYETDATLTSDTEMNFSLARTVFYYRVYGYFDLEDSADPTGISIRLGSSTRTTDGDGYFEFTDVAGDGGYIFTASKAGYISYSETVDIDGDTEISGVLVPEGSVELYPPARCNASDGYLGGVLVTWEAPIEPGLYEIAYDDGTAEREPGGYTHIGGGGMPSLEWGVQFTPPVAGCELVALKYNFLIEGATSTASIYVRSIVADTPASTLIPNFNATIDTMSTWSVIEIPGGLPLSGRSDFYVGYRDAVVGRETTSVYIGCDKGTERFNRSWIYYSGWNLLSDDVMSGLGSTDLMIRAIVRLPDGALAELSRTPSGETDVTGIEKSAGAPGVLAAKLVPSDRADSETAFTVRRTIERAEGYKTVAPLRREAEHFGYNVYRALSPFTTISGASLIGTTDISTLSWVDTVMSGITPAHLYIMVLRHSGMKAKAIFPMSMPAGIRSMPIPPMSSLLTSQEESLLPSSVKLILSVKLTILPILWMILESKMSWLRIPLRVFIAMI